MNRKFDPIESMIKKATRNISKKPIITNEAL